MAEKRKADTSEWQVRPIEQVPSRITECLFLWDSDFSAAGPVKTGAPLSELGESFYCQRGERFSGKIGISAEVLMRKLSLLLVAACFLSASLLAQAQSPEEVLHAPDGNSREIISSILIPPLTNAPFQATVTAEWTKHLPDGTTTVVKNHRLVVRDSRGRIYQERRTLVPDGSPQRSLIFRIEISDPVTHTKYFCDPSLSECELRSYNMPVTEPVIPAGEIANGTRYLSRASLGTRTIEGLEAVGTRETVTIQTGVIGNNAPIDSTKEFWFSPKLDLNLQVLRLDPLHGDQLFNVTDLRLSEPDARLFVLPPGCKVVDLREKQGNTSTSVH